MKYNRGDFFYGYVFGFWSFAFSGKNNRKEQTTRNAHTKKSDS